MSDTKVTEERANALMELLTAFELKHLIDGRIIDPDDVFKRLADTRKEQKKSEKQFPSITACYICRRIAVKLGIEK